MDNLPQELLDEIFQQLKEYDFPVTERWASLTPSSREAILNSRLVQRRWYKSSSLRSCFVSVLEEVPFVWNNHRLPTLEAISDWEGVECFTTLSICGFDLALVEEKAYYRWDDGRNALNAELPIVPYIVHLMQRFYWVEHVRFYTIHPKCVDGTWGPDWKLTLGDQIGYEQQPKWVEEPAWGDLSAESSHWMYTKVMEALCRSDSCIQSVEMPLMGNRATYCGVYQNMALYFLAYLPLTRVSITVAVLKWDDNPTSFMNDSLKDMKSLEFLEVAIVRSPYDIAWTSGLGPIPRLHDLLSYDHLTETAPDFQLLSLKEFRLMSDYQISFSVSNVLHCLSMFPNLERLGFAHMLMEQGTWPDLLLGLAPLSLARLWLLDPRNLRHPGRLSDNTLQKYETEPCLVRAAREVRLIDTGSMWTAENHQPLKRDFQYPGFRVFEIEEKEGE